MHKCLELEACQSLQISLPHRAYQCQVRTAAIAFHSEQTGIRQLFQVVGDGRGTDLCMFLKCATANTIRHCSDLLQDCITSRICESTTNRTEPIVIHDV